MQTEKKRTMSGNAIDHLEIGSRYICKFECINSSKHIAIKPIVLTGHAKRDKDGSINTSIAILDTQSLTPVIPIKN